MVSPKVWGAVAQLTYNVTRNITSAVLLSFVTNYPISNMFDIWFYSVNDTLIAHGCLNIGIPHYAISRKYHCHWSDTACSIAWSIWSGLVVPVQTVLQLTNSLIV